MDAKTGDREAFVEIERLHQNDIAASKRRDFDALRALVSDEAVIFPEGGNVVRGKPEIDRWFLAMKKSMEDYGVLAYSMKFEEIQVYGEYAFEWAYARESARNRRTGEIEKGTSKLFRVLKREEGQWKVYRTIWNQ